MPPSPEKRSSARKRAMSSGPMDAFSLSPARAAPHLLRRHATIAADGAAGDVSAAVAIAAASGQRYPVRTLTVPATATPVPAAAGALPVQQHATLQQWMAIADRLPHLRRLRITGVGGEGAAGGCVWVPPRGALPRSVRVVIVDVVSRRPPHPEVLRRLTAMLRSSSNSKVCILARGHYAPHAGWTRWFLTAPAPSSDWMERSG